MCVIAVSKGRKLSIDCLQNMWTRNSDGAGIAYIQKDQVIVTKGFMTFDDFMQAYSSIPAAPHAIHFRLATHGSITPQFTHPFRVDIPDTLELEYKAKQVLFHNGIIRNWERFARLTNTPLSCSDTYCFARYLATLDDQGKEALIKKQKYSRFALLTPNSIILFGSFHKLDGFLFSNLNWL